MAGVLTVKIVGESRDAIKAIDHVEGKLGRLSGVASGVGRAVMGAAVAATAGVVAAGAFAVSAIKSASDLGETVSKTNVIFGEQAAAGMMKLADGAASALGLSERAYLEFSSGFGNMLVSIGGLSQEAAAKQAAGLTTMASDLASFNNTTTAESAAALTSALTGEFEPLKRYGVVINDAVLKAKALELGLLDSTGAMDSEAKQAATLALVYEQTATAQGDFAETSGGAANQARILAAQFENLKSDLGQKLLPVAVKAFTFLNNMFPKIAAIAGPALDKIVVKVKSFVTAVREAWPQVKDILTTAMAAVVGAFKAALPAIQSVIAAAIALIPTVVAVAEAFGGLVGFLKENPEYLAAIALGLAVVLIPAVIAWAVATATAAAAHVALAVAAAVAYLPIIALVAAVAALAAGIIWAYQNVGWFRDAIQAVASFMKDVLWPIIKKVIDIYLAYAGVVITVAGYLLDKLIPAVGAVISWFADMGTNAGRLATTIFDKVEAIVGFFVDLPGRIKDATVGMFDGIKNAFRSAVNWIIDKWNGLSFTVGGGEFLGQSIPSATLSTPNMPRLHSGGIVPGNYGEEVMVILEAGERVRTREQEAALGRGRGGVYIENLNAANRPLLEELAELDAQMGFLAA